MASLKMITWHRIILHSERENGQSLGRFFFSFSVSFLFFVFFLWKNPFVLPDFLKFDNHRMGNA
eukprot:m.93130 g.93130  ORF g.93130 m.93130 type:complete len:64 (+) comp18304_c0_seq3:1623-1814(+)